MLVGGLEGGGLQDLRPWAWARRPAARTEQGGPRCRLHPLQDKSSALIFPVRVRGKGFVPLGNRGLGQVDRAPPGHTGPALRSFSVATSASLEPGVCAERSLLGRGALGALGVRALKAPVFVPATSAPPGGALPQ